MTKIGLDGHDRGVKVIAQALRDAGMEVIYAGLRRTPDEIARIVLQEDADVLGLSILSGAVVPLTTQDGRCAEGRSSEDVLLMVGGIVPKPARRGTQRDGHPRHLRPGRVAGGHRQVSSRRTCRKSLKV